MRILCLALMTLGLACAQDVPPLTEANRAAVEAAFKDQSIPVPASIVLSDAFVVATLQVPETRILTSHREMAETAVIAMRNVLRENGFAHYRVSINGPSPGPGLTRRIGSARFSEDGRVNWSAGQ